LKSILIIAVVMESGNHKLRARNRNFYESHKCGTQNQSSGQASCSTRFISVLQAFLFSLVDFHSSDVHTLAIVICNCIFYHCIKLSLFGDNLEFTTRKRNHCKNARAPTKAEGYRVVAL